MDATSDNAKIRNNLDAVRERIKRACTESGRDPLEINLLAVSKTKPLELIEAALSCDQFHFGENYLQEAIGKIESIDDKRAVWHFIGAIQSNKTRQIARYFDWVHTVASMKIAKRLNDQRSESSKPLNILLQVNIDKESTKAGFAEDDIHSMIEPMTALARVRLRGLMAIPAPNQHINAQRDSFRRLRLLKQSLEDAFDLKDFNHLSMGMSADLEAAVAEGSTQLRIGTAIFGARN